MAIRLALLLLAVGCGRSQVPALPLLERPIVFAHRGGAGEAPESTLPAFMAAARDPAVAVELDVRATRDGALVVIHDATVDRTTDGTGRVADLTLAELQALDAGHCATPGLGNGTARRGQCPARAGADPGRFPFRGRGIRIPTLAQVLAALPRETFIGIELKSPGLAAPLAAQLRASGRLSRLVIGSMDGDLTTSLRELLPEVPRYFPRAAAVRLAAGAKLTPSTSTALSWPDHHVLAAPRSGWGVRLDSQAMVEAYHRRGVAVVYFTINDQAEMERLFRLGADGIFTDYPTQARQVIDRLRAAGALPRVQR